MTNKSSKSTKTKKPGVKKQPEPALVTQSLWTTRALSAWKNFAGFFRKNWRGTLVILIATFIFFWPIIIHITNYSVGGDAMFNAWTLDRDQHCILRQGCPYFDNANIFFPNKDSMLYSEVQLSAGLVTLPLHLMNSNPLFAYNVWTIVSFFLAGWFMYLLIKYLSKGNETLSILAALIFEFAPFKMAAIWHLQNLSIFCLPLAVLLVYRFFDTNKKRYLVGLLITLLYQFFGSWYQMVFVAIVLGIILTFMLLFKRAHWKKVLLVAFVVAVAALATLPLAEQYIKWSKATNSAFSIQDQTLYSSSVYDYFIPNNGTLIGKIYYKLNPGTQVNAYNLDSFSYHGITLYVLAAVLLVIAFRQRKRSEKDKRRFQEIAMLIFMFMVGFLLSLGPLLKVKGSFTYATLSGTNIQLAVPAPWILIDKYLPQLEFIRAIGRISVLCEFALCCLLAYLALYLKEANIQKKYKQFITILVCVLTVIELAPLHLVPMVQSKYAYNLNVPAVYKFIANDKQINDLIVLQAENYYGINFQFDVPETVMWAGYTNKNFYNGYSGYTPPNYQALYDSFNNFTPKDAGIMKKLGLRYVVVDKLLTRNKPGLIPAISTAFPDEVYHDGRYDIFKIQ